MKWDGIEYDGIYHGVLADESYINKKIGEVKFAYLQSLQFDGTNYNWFLDDTVVLSNEIQEFFPK